MGWAHGGRIPINTETYGVPVVMTASRSARRIDSHHAVITCGACHEDTPFERTDGEPLTSADIGNALAELDHDCKRWVA